MKTVTESTNELKKRGKTIQILYLVFGMMLAVALIVGAFRQYIAAAAIVAADFIWYFVFLVRQRRKFSDDVIAANVLYGVCEPLTDAKYLGKNSLSPEELDAMDILPVHIARQSVLTENGFEGKSNRLTLKGWEISFPYIVPGVKSRDMYRHLSGTLLTAERSAADPEISSDASVSDTENEWLLIHRRLLHDAAQQEFLTQKGYHQADCSSEELLQSFDVYCKSEGRVLSEQLTKAVLKAYRQAEKIAAVRFSERSSQVFLYRSFYTLRTRLRFLPDESWYKHNLLAERDTVWSLFKAWKTAK